MHIVAVCPEAPSEDSLETAQGPGTSTDRGTPPSHQASRPSPGIPQRNAPSSLTIEVPEPGERERGPFSLGFFSLALGRDMQTRRAADDEAGPETQIATGIWET